MPDRKGAQPQTGSGSQMLMMMLLFVTMFVMFDPGMRNSVGTLAGLILEPLIGFDGKYPVMTVAISGLILITFSSAVRHYFIDWVDTAERQARMKDFNKRLKEARASGSDAEVKKFTQKQMDMSKDQMKSTVDQMKPMMFTMIFLVATFAFIGTFMQAIPGATLSVPWAYNVDMNASISSSTCCAFSNWMILYSLISIATSQVVSRALKLYSFSRVLNDPEALARLEASDSEAGEEEPQDDGWDRALEADDDSEFLEIEDEPDGDGEPEDDPRDDDEYPDDELEGEDPAEG